MTTTMRRIPRLLSKTKLMRGYRCLKSIYLTIHQPQLEPPVTPELQALFDQGNQVGETARRYLPGGTLVDCKPWEFGEALTKTRALIAAGTQTIYEAAFEYQGCYARADIIQYSPESKRFSIYEVKSTMSVKPEHLQDVGLQTWIMAKSGLPIEKIHIMHLNRECRYPNLDNLFVTVDVTEEMRTRYPNVIGEVKGILDTITKDKIPDIHIGPQCHEPSECPFIAHCWKDIPPVSIFNLPGLKNRKWELYQDGIITLDDERLTELTELQQRMIDVFKSGERYINREAVKAALADWQYPFVYLDFETINPAIPRYPGTAPYQQVPFQFSAHRMEQAGGQLTHQEYLHTDISDPRPELIKALLQACGSEGSIIAYYKKFESDRIQELADFSEVHRDALLALLPRLVDPLPIFRDSVYDSAFAGSFSLKYVAPAILGKEQSYTGMMVANGGDAQRAFETILSPAVTAERKNDLIEALRAYCTKDTLVMVDLVNWMFTC